jgi:hypothetical protein
MDDIIRAVNQYEELEMATDQQKLMDQRVQLRETHLKKINDRTAQIQ